MDSTRQLNRTLGVGMVIAMAVANIIGSGVYKKIAPMASELHSPGWVLICWVLGGVISLFGALSNAELAGLLADTGGEYVYYKKIYNRFFAFLLGWSLFTVIQSAAISSLAYIFAQSLQGILHLPALFSSWEGVNIGGVFYPFASFTIKLMAITLILVFTWVNCRGIRAGASISTAVLLLVLAGLFTIVVFGLTSREAHPGRALTMQSVQNTTISFSAIFTAMLAAFWAYQGWASVGFIGGEIKNPNKNIPRGLAAGVFIIITIYLLVNFTYLSLLSIPQLEGIYHSQESIAAIEAVKIFWGRGGELFISLLIAVTTLNTTHATILVSSRMYYAMAREGLFFASVRKLNQAKVPANSLWFQGVWSSILVMSGTFDQLTDMIIFAVFIFYGATALGVFVLRKKMPVAARPYKVWGYPFVPAVVVVFSFVLFFNTIFARPREAVIGMVLMLIGVPMYFWFKKNKPPGTGTSITRSVG